MKKDVRRINWIDEVKLVDRKRYIKEYGEDRWEDWKNDSKYDRNLCMFQEDSGIIDKCLPYFSAIPVVSNKPKECLRALLDAKYVEVFGEPFDSRQLMAMIAYFTNVPRGKIYKSTLTSVPKYATLTPLVMYALKRDKGIPYEYWDKHDPYIDHFLTSTALKAALFGNIPDLSEDEVKTLRSLYIRKGKQGCRTYRVTGFNKDAGISGVHELTRHMIFQTWLACEDCRDVETMILDPINWDNIPNLFATGISRSEEPYLQDLDY